MKRTNKAEIQPKNKVRKRRVFGRIDGMKYSLKGYKDRNRHKNKIKEWTSSVGFCLT